jgi:hypothetical protein
MDISAKIGSLKIAFEYEKYDHKSPEIWMKKKEAALETHDLVKFVCNATDAKIISKVVGEEYTLRRGVAVSEFIESLARDSRIHDSGMVSYDYEANAAV